MKRSARLMKVESPAKRFKVNADEDDKPRIPLLQMSVNTKKTRAVKQEPSVDLPVKNEPAIKAEVESEEEDFETRRLQNIADNARFLASLGMIDAKHQLDVSSKKRVVKPSMNGIAKEKKPPAPPLPRRQSLRIRRIDPDGNSLPEPPPTLQEPEYDHPRKPSGPLEMVGCVTNSVEEDLTRSFIQSVDKLTCKDYRTSEPSLSLNKYVDEMKKLDLTGSRVAKLVPQRIFSLAVHPGEDKLITCAGDKWGRLGVWDVGSNVGQDGVYCFEPHSRPINFVQFDPNSPNNLFSCSYDGTLRKCDFNKAEFAEVYVTDDDDGIRLNCFNFLTPSTLVVSQSNCSIAVIDTRAGLSAQQEFVVHDRSVRSIHVNPVKSDFIATSSPDTTVRLWDMRHMSSKKSKPLDVLNHSRGVDSAYFSPISGEFLLTTSMDDAIKVFDVADMTQTRLSSYVRHNNHTGRWLTNFKACWHPRRDDMFVVGSMERPRQIELFSSQCKMLHKMKNSDHLNSVCSINVIHPTRNIVVGGNSSGRVHVFM